MEKLPADLKKLLTVNPATKAVWLDLTPIAQRDFVSWIESVKQPETRRRRIESVPSRLASGKRRPCCYAIVPMSLYKALGTNLKAKTQWKILTPDQRRDLVAWVEEAKDAGAREKRINTVCAKLAKAR